MKYTYNLLSAIFICLACSTIGRAQGTVITIGGTGVHGYSGDNGPAVNAMLGYTYGVSSDGNGNVYFGDQDNKRFRKISAVTGIITTVGGTGISGDSGDGGPGYNAQIGSAGGIHVTATGNLFFTDWGRLRRIDGQTGIMTTCVASVATASQGVMMDSVGNVFFSGVMAQTRVVDTVTGVVTVIAGNGVTTLSSGDGGLATSAGIVGTGMAMDPAGNLYIADDYNHNIRRVDHATGIITTVAGIAGNPGHTGDGGPATSATLKNPVNVAITATGDLLIADQAGGIRKVDANTGIITKVVNDTVNYMHLDEFGNVFYSSNNKIKKALGVAPTITSAADSFSLSAASSCNGYQLTLFKNHFVAGEHLIIDYGDNTGTVDSTFTNMNGAAVSVVNHAYSTTGTYTVNLKLYNGATLLDSLDYTVNQTFCHTAYVEFYYDADSSCTKDYNEHGFMAPVLVEVDSNNVIVDTISATSGLYYTATGNNGDVYEFKVISMPVGVATTCPANGIVSVTLQDANVFDPLLIGFNCTSPANFDLSVDGIVHETRPWGQRGTAFGRNELDCLPVNAVVTLNYSPHYAYQGTANPVPTTVAGNSISWNLAALAGNNIYPEALYYELEDAVGNPPMLGDTVQTYITITPTAGDANTVNNSILLSDTVRSSWDPNIMEVTPKGNITAGTQLTYRIEFENVGNDTAHNIHVQDTLPSGVDVNSIRIVSATHEMYVSPYKSGNYNIVKFDFPGINLLDSSHHGKCTGTFSYTINTKTGLPFGTLIDHSVGIYFDANEVVQTNMVENMIGWPASVANAGSTDKIGLYPNPATDELTIVTGMGMYNYCTITNNMGQVVMQQQLNGAQTKLNVKALGAGMYYINMVGDRGNVVRKFVKQ